MPVIAFVIILNSMALPISLLAYQFFIKRYSVKTQPRAGYLLAFVLPIFFISVTLRTINSVQNTLDYGILSSNVNAIDGYEQTSLTILAFLCICAVLFAYEKVMKQIDNENERVLLDAEISAQRRYVAEAKEKYNTTKAFRHDFKNHIIALHGLVDRKEFEKAGSYLDRFEAIYDEISFAANTGNTVVDILLGEKLSYAEKLGIHVKCDVAIPSEVEIDDFDLCAVLQMRLITQSKLV